MTSVRRSFRPGDLAMDSPDFGHTIYVIIAITGGAATCRDTYNHNIYWVFADEVELVKQAGTYLDD